MKFKKGWARRDKIWDDCLITGATFILDDLVILSLTNSNRNNHCQLSRSVTSFAPQVWIFYWTAIKLNAGLKKTSWQFCNLSVLISALFFFCRISNWKFISEKRAIWIISTNNLYYDPSLIKKCLEKFFWSSPWFLLPQEVDSLMIWG